MACAMSLNKQEAVNKETAFEARALCRGSLVSYTGFKNSHMNLCDYSVITCSHYKGLLFYILYRAYMQNACFIWVGNSKDFELLGYFKIHMIITEIVGDIPTLKIDMRHRVSTIKGPQPCILGLVYF